MATATRIRKSDVPPDPTTQEETQQFRVLLDKLATAIYIPDATLDVLEPGDLAYLLMRSMQHRRPSGFGASVANLCASLRGVIAAVPEFQPRAN